MTSFADIVQANGEIEFTIPGLDCIVKTRSTRVNYQDEYNYSWSSRVIHENSADDCDCSDGAVTLIRREGKYIGQFSIEEHHFELHHIKNDVHFLSRYNYDESLEHGCGNEGSTLEQGLVAQNVPENEFSGAKMSENCPVRILVYYTPAAEDAVPDINAVIDLAMEQTNQVLQNSELDFEVILAGVSSLDFVENEDIEVDLQIYAGLLSFPPFRKQ